MRRRLAAIAIAHALLFSAAGLQAQSVQTLEDWTDTASAQLRLPAGWRFYGKEAAGRRMPGIVIDEGRHALRLKTEHYSVRIAREVHADTRALPTLTWEWKALTLPRHGDVRGEVNDQVARMVLIFAPRYRPRMIAYVWDTQAPVGTEVHQRQMMVDRWLVVVRSGAAGVGTWVRETRNLERDHARLFGTAASSLLAIGVESHSEDADHASEVLVGPITLAK